MGNKSKRLRDLFSSDKIIRIMGAHDGLGARLIEQHGFDGVWASGLEISTAHAVPDANVLTMTENLVAAQNMNDATALPVVCDCDTGYGNASNVMHMVKKYEAAGIAAVVIEDKLFPKVNSFIPGRQQLAGLREFCGKIQAAKSVQIDSNFMVIARVEALIAGWGMDEALRRAEAYAEAGADALVIHSKAKTPDEIFEFALRWKHSIPLIAIPTTYYCVTAGELRKKGFGMVIYANHGLRASIQAMHEAFASIEKHGTTAQVEERIASMKEVFELQGMNDMKEDEERFVHKEKIAAVIPAAGDHAKASDLGSILNGNPLCMTEIGGKTLIDRQADVLRSAGVTDITVVGGYAADQLRCDGATIVKHTDYERHHSAHSLMLAEKYFHDRVVMVYSDIVFDKQIIDRLLTSPHDITLVVDRAYRHLPFREKKLDLVLAEESGQKGARRLNLNEFTTIRKIGKKIDKQKANCEFIGIALVQGKGVKILKKYWQEALKDFKDRSFQEASHVNMASFTDLMQYLIDKNIPVKGMEIEYGWSEIHSAEDWQRINSFYQKSQTMKATVV